MRTRLKVGRAIALVAALAGTCRRVRSSLAAVFERKPEPPELQV